MADLSAEEKASLFRRLWVLEQTVNADHAALSMHIRICSEENTRASHERRSFRKEMRSYCVAIILALIGFAAATGWRIF